MADDGRTQVDFVKMKEAEDDFRRAFNALRAELTDLNTELKVDLAPWVGKANSAYEIEQTNWNNAADDMATTISHFGGTLSDIHATYQQAEAANTRLWESG